MSDANNDKIMESLTVTLSLAVGEAPIFTTLGS